MHPKPCSGSPLGCAKSWVQKRRQKSSFAHVWVQQFLDPPPGKKSWISSGQKGKKKWICLFTRPILFSCTFLSQPLPEKCIIFSSLPRWSTSHMPLDWSSKCVSVPESEHQLKKMAKNTFGIFLLMLVGKA